MPKPRILGLPRYQENQIIFVSHILCATTWWFSSGLHVTIAFELCEIISEYFLLECLCLVYTKKYTPTATSHLNRIATKKMELSQIEFERQSEPTIYIWGVGFSLVFLNLYIPFKETHLPPFFSACFLQNKLLGLVIYKVMKS